MKLLHFVSASSVILAGWLAVTFVYHVPAQRYQKTDKSATVSTAGRKTAAVPRVAAQPADFLVSASH